MHEYAEAYLSHVMYETQFPESTAKIHQKYKDLGVETGVFRLIYQAVNSDKLLEAIEIMEKIPGLWSRGNAMAIGWKLAEHIGVAKEIAENVQTEMQTHPELSARQVFDQLVASPDYQDKNSKFQIIERLKNTPLMEGKENQANRQAIAEIKHPKEFLKAVPVLTSNNDPAQVKQRKFNLLIESGANAEAMASMLAHVTPAFLDAPDNSKLLKDNVEHSASISQGLKSYSGDNRSQSLFSATEEKLQRPLPANPKEEQAIIRAGANAAALGDLLQALRLKKIVLDDGDYAKIAAKIATDHKQIKSISDGIRHCSLFDIPAYHPFWHAVLEEGPNTPVLDLVQTIKNRVIVLNQADCEFIINHSHHAQNINRLLFMQGNWTRWDWLTEEQGNNFELIKENVERLEFILPCLQKLPTTIKVSQQDFEYIISLDKDVVDKISGDLERAKRVDGGITPQKFQAILEKTRNPSLPSSASLITIVSQRDPDSPLYQKEHKSEGTNALPRNSTNVTITNDHLYGT